jgi:hypothetical protein
MGHWKDEKNPLGPPEEVATETPVDAANLEAMEARLEAPVAIIREAPLNVEQAPFNADGTRTKDSTAAFEAAIAALPERGGEIFCPGAYKLSGKLNFDGKRTCRMTGVGGRGSGLDPASQLLFTQGSAEPFISAKAAQGFSMEGIEIEYTNGAQTGAAIDLQETGEGSLTRVHVIGAGGIHSALGVNLNTAQVIGIHDCQFSGLDIALKGRKEAGAEHFSNVIQVDNTSFNGMGTASVYNIGLGWNFNTCAFEPLASGKAGAINADAGVIAEGTVLQSCFWGDANAEGTQIIWRGKGLSILGGYLGSGALGVSVPDATSDGLVVMGVKFISIADAIRANFGAGTQRYVIGANFYEASVSGKKVSLDNGATDAGAGFLSH